MNDTIYEIIRQPVVTEKSTNLASQNKVVFKVRNDADKPAIKKAVETIFGVKVSGVNVLNVKGKQKRFRGKLGVRKDYKKAIVTLAEGQQIDMMGGIR